MEITISLDKDNLDKTKENARKLALSEYGSDDNSLLYSDMNFTANGDLSYDENNNELYLSGDINQSGGNNFGYMSISIPVDIDIALNIIQAYIKKFNKLKTVLEATK